MRIEEAREKLSHGSSLHYDLKRAGLLYSSKCDSLLRYASKHLLFAMFRKLCCNGGIKLNESYVKHCKMPCNVLAVDTCFYSFVLVLQLFLFLFSCNKPNFTSQNHSLYSSYEV